MHLYRKWKKRLKASVKKTMKRMGLKKTYYAAGHILRLIKLETVHGYCVFTGILRKYGITFNKNAMALHAYRNKYVGQRCFLIGNGPSLTTKDLEALQNEITFGCNRVYKLFQDTTWRPSYFCMIDALIAKYNSDELAEHIECPMFTNFSTKNLLKCQPQNLVYIRNLGVNPYRISPNFEAYYVPSGATVMTFMIELAMFMGFSEINLIGVDCTSSLVTNGHCAHDYVNPELIQKDVERVRKRLKDSTLTPEQVAAYYYEKSTFSYAILRAYSEKKGIHIYNVTRGGMLEVFERKNLDEIVRG